MSLVDIFSQHITEKIALVYGFRLADIAEGNNFTDRSYLEYLTRFQDFLCLVRDIYGMSTADAIDDYCRSHFPTGDDVYFLTFGEIRETIKNIILSTKF
ncbi:MAG: hypothetical protein Q4C70_05005 [Planctomycetia bacterium]|nr:hypothetical protein [Planctomycetia bacterium]